jgi:hypothetical protein
MVLLFFLHLSFFITARASNEEPSTCMMVRGGGKSSSSSRSSGKISGRGSGKISGSVGCHRRKKNEAFAGSCELPRLVNVVPAAGDGTRHQSPARLGGV